MLLFIGFPANERALLENAAELLGVTNRCSYLDELGSIGEDGLQIDSGTVSKKYPSVIFLNLDSAGGLWKNTLSELKDHPQIGSVPVVGLGRLEQSDILKMYSLGGNSYVAKPDTFDEMTRIAKTVLDYWLDISQLPAKHLNEA